jgi:hypothetical protein
MAFEDNAKSMRYLCRHDGEDEDTFDQIAGQTKPAIRVQLTGTLRYLLLLTSCYSV